MADFLSWLDKPLPKEEVQDYLDKIPYPGVKAVLDNAITPLEERAELGVRPNPEGVKAHPEEAVAARAAKMASTNIIDWKVEQKDDPLPSGEAPSGSPGNLQRSSLDGSR